MSTKQQRINTTILQKKAHKKTPALLQCPQVRGTVVRLRILTPKKPNSARRPVVKVKLVNRRRLTAHIPGIGHTLRKHSDVLIRGGGARDLPGVNYSCSRGVYDLHGVITKSRRRSIYGKAKPTIEKKKVRRKFRKI